MAVAVRGFFVAAGSDHDKNGARLTQMAGRAETGWLFFTQIRFVAPT